MGVVKIFPNLIDLTEATIDAEARVVRNVTLIREGMSLNRKHYPAKVLQAATPLFEGLRAYDSHLSGTRKVADTTGWYANVRFEEGKIIADRYFARTQAGNDVWAIVEDIVAKRAPATLAGLSINAVGKGSPQQFADGAGIMVEAITAVSSVDDVTTPAAGGMYLTASSDDELTTALLKAMPYEQFLEARPDFISRYRREVQTVKRTEAVAAADAEANRLREKLEESSALTSDLQTQLEKTSKELTEARQALEIERALRGIELPAEWETALREELTDAAPEKWVTVVKRYARLAASAGVKQSRVPVTDAGQRIVTQEALIPASSQAIRWDEIETVEDYINLKTELEQRGTRL